MKRVKHLLTVLGMLVCGTGVAFAKGEIEVEFTADYFGKYVWRGQNLDDDNVFQPGISVSYDGFTVGIWGSLELTNINNNNEFTEVDYSLDYSGSIPGLSGVGYSAGLIYYDFPNTATADTTEIYWGLNFDLPASPSITFYHDLDEVEGTYISLGAGHSIENIMELGSGVPVEMEIGASFGWGDDSYNNYYWGINQGKINDFVLSASFPIEVAGWTVTPSMNYVTLFSDNIRNSDVYDTNSDFFFAGISVSKRF